MKIEFVLGLVVGALVLSAAVWAYTWWQNRKDRRVSDALREIAAANAERAEEEREKRLTEITEAERARTRGAREGVNDHANGGSNFVDDPPFRRRRDD